MALSLTQTDDDGHEMWITYNSFPVAISGLEIRGDKIVIAIKDQQAERSLEFDLADVLTRAKIGK